MFLISSSHLDADLLDLLDSTVQWVGKIFLVVEVGTFAGVVHSFHSIMKYSEHI